MKEYALANPGVVQIAKTRYRDSHPEEYRARTVVGNALRDGKIVRPGSCQTCGKSCKPQAHHYRGHAPEFHLDVEWLCRTCHNIADHPESLVIPTAA